MSPGIDRDKCTSGSILNNERPTIQQPKPKIEHLGKPFGVGKEPFMKPKEIGYA